MSKHALPCIVCAKPLVNVIEESDNQPSGGAEFTTLGHYGSFIIDEVFEAIPMEFVVNICDTCILRAIDKGVIQSRSKQIALSRHAISEKKRAWVLAQNEKQYGCAWGEDEAVDYRAMMLKAGWPEHLLDQELGPEKGEI